MGTVTAAYACSAATEQVQLKEVSVRSALAPTLPDCRGYEQVSPVDKNGVDALGTASAVEASPSGNGVLFFAISPFPGTVGAGQLPTYLSTRETAGSGWSTQGIEALAPAAAVEQVVGVTEDLSKSIVKVGSPQSAPPCEPLVVVCGLRNEINAYIHDDASGTFEFLAALGNHEVGFAGAGASGSRILFETNAKLTAAASAGTVNLYEWNAAEPRSERISLAGVLPNGTAPKMGSNAGPAGPAVGPAGRPFLPEAMWRFYTQDTISEDGSRIFFTSSATGRIYMREPETGKSVQISGTSEGPLREEEESGKPVETEPAFWRGATRNGSFVYYTEAGELFRFDVEKFVDSNEPEEAALAEAREQITIGAEGVLGLAGFSEEGDAYIYLVAPGVLAANENGNKEKAAKGGANLYEWHEGVLTFIVTLRAAESGQQRDEPDWRGWTNNLLEATGPAGGQKSSRVSGDGRYLLFSSTRQLTKYNNAGNAEFYLLDGAKPLSTDDPLCVSCNPMDVSASKGAYLTKRNIALVAEPPSRNGLMTHNLSVDGRRVFFETEEALIPGDANMRSDVYEWEADGEGSCESERQDGGCLYLISTGQGLEGAYFGDASSNGDDVFFFTRQPGLVGQDQDNNVDAYDAHVEGGIPSQYPAAPIAPCEDETECRENVSGESPAFGAPASTTLYGVGNLVQAPSPPSATPAPHIAETRAEKLAKALRACRTKSKVGRTSCERAVRKRYGPVRRKNKISGAKDGKGGRRR